MQHASNFVPTALSEYLISKYWDTTIVYSNTLGIRVTKVDNMSSDRNSLADPMVMSEYLGSKYSDPTMVYSNTMGIRVIIVDYMRLRNNCGTFCKVKAEHFARSRLRAIKRNVACRVRY